MFNDQHYQAALADMKDKISAEHGGAWATTVNLRYGIFLAEIAHRQIDGIVKGLVNYSDATADQRKFREGYAGEMMQAVSTLHAAAALIRGSVIVPNPLDCEAAMRLHAEANHAQAA